MTELESRVEAFLVAGGKDHGAASDEPRAANEGTVPLTCRGLECWHAEVAVVDIQPSPHSLTTCASLV